MCRGESCDKSSSSNSSSSSSDNRTKNKAVISPPAWDDSTIPKVDSSSNYVRGRAEDGAVINGSLRPKFDCKDDTTTASLRQLKIGIHGKWYNATRFAAHHPGGDIIYEFHEKDATAQFLAYHDAKLLDRYKLPLQGEYEYDMDKPGGSTFQGDWMKLNDKFEKDGRYKTPLSFLYSRIAILVVAVVGMITMIHLYCATASCISFVVGCACMAGIWQQAGFLMHDTMHNHILHNRKGDQRLGFIFGNVFLGVSGRWWRDEHNEHHVFTNTIVEGVGPADPQMIEDVWIQDERLIPYFVQCTVKFMLEYQQFYFVPLLVLVGLFPIKVDAITHTDRYLPDFAGLALHIGWVAAVLSLLPSASERLAFYIISNCISGCLGIQLLVSHYAKPWAEKNDTKEPGSWAARQVDAVMDITCPTWLDWFHGGLHIHSVHHMFPRMCRCHYRAVYNDIIGMCEKHGVQLDQRSWFDAIGSCIQHFSTIKHKAEMSKKAKPE